MKWRALKAKQDCSFWWYTKHRKGFSEINDSVNYYLQKWIVSHPHVIKYTTDNDYIEFKFNNGNVGVNNELLQKVLLRVSFRELHIDMLKNMLLGFPWHMMKNDLPVLVVQLFYEFFFNNYKIWPSAIKLCVVTKYVSITEHTKSRLIIDVSGDWDN